MLLVCWHPLIANRTCVWQESVWVLSTSVTINKINHNNFLMYSHRAFCTANLMQVNTGQLSDLATYQLAIFLSSKMSAPPQVQLAIFLSSKMSVPPQVDNTSPWLDKWGQMWSTAQRSEWWVQPGNGDGGTSWSFCSWENYSRIYPLSEALR